MWLEKETKGDQIPHDNVAAFITPTFVHNIFQTEAETHISTQSLFLIQLIETKEKPANSSKIKATGDHDKRRISYPLDRNLSLAFANLVVLLQVAVELLQHVQVELLLQLDWLAQVLQHLLREATRETAADMIDHGGLQPHVPLSQQPVTQVVPEDRETSSGFRIQTVQCHLVVSQKSFPHSDTQSIR